MKDLMSMRLVSLLRSSHWFILSFSAILAGCAPQPERAQDITLKAPEVSNIQAVSSQAVSSQAAPTPSGDNPQKGPAFRVVNVVRNKPDCQGDTCPSITLKRLSFEGYERFNAFLERSLLALALIDTSKSTTFRSLSDLANAFWQTAEDRYEIVLGADVKRSSPGIVVVELQSYAFTGGAHGMSTSQYINWSPRFDRIITLNDLVLPGRMKAFEAALKNEYVKWLNTNEFAQNNRADYLKMWPFQFSDNAALMEDGIAVTFGHYVLGPYALGMPTILVPNTALKGIVNTGLVKRLSQP